jgi:hypothetical protein
MYRPSGEGEGSFCVERVEFRKTVRFPGEMSSSTWNMGIYGLKLGTD